MPPGGRHPTCRDFLTNLLTDLHAILQTCCYVKSIVLLESGIHTKTQRQIFEIATCYRLSIQAAFNRFARPGVLVIKSQKRIKRRSTLPSNRSIKLKTRIHGVTAIFRIMTIQKVVTCCLIILMTIAEKTECVPIVAHSYRKSNISCNSLFCFTKIHCF